MKFSEQPEIVTLLACPPTGSAEPSANAFIDDVTRVLASKKAAGNLVVKVASMRDADLALGQCLHPGMKSQVRLQVVGHSISGMLSLGASWIPEREMSARAFRFPYYVLDTNPGSLGLLAKYAGRISEVMLVGCNIGGASSFGYAVNGRTLTYTLAELLRCMVRGADDVVAPDEFDAHGWYVPNPHHRRPKGWRWTEASPPVWTDPGLDPVARGRTNLDEVFEVTAITRSLLPVVASAHAIEPAIQLVCTHTASDPPRSALADISIETDRGPAALLCGGRFLRWLDTYYVVERNPQLAAALTALLWGSHGEASEPATLSRTSVAG